MAVPLRKQLGEGFASFVSGKLGEYVFRLGPASLANAIALGLPDWIDDPNSDDRQDLLATAMATMIPSAFALLRLDVPGINFPNVERASKEFIEDAVAHRRSLLTMPQGERRGFVNSLIERHLGPHLVRGATTVTKPQPKSFWDRLTECSPVLITQFRTSFDEAFPREIANPNGPGQIVNPERVHIMDELGRIATTKERVLLVISSRDWQELREYLEHLIKESKKLPEADRSLLAHALHRLGVAQMSEEVVNVKEDVNKKLRDAAAAQASKAKTLRDAGF